MTTGVLAGYDLLLVIWGGAWMLLGSGLMYLLHRVMVTEDREATREALAVPEASRGEAAAEPAAREPALAKR